MSFLKRLFGKRKSDDTELTLLVRESLQGVLDRSSLNLSFDIFEEESEQGEITIRVDFNGDDGDKLTEKDGSLLDALQLFCRRVVQHQLSEARCNLVFDYQGYRESANQELVDLAEKLKEVALEKKRSVYFRALPPKERKIVHQYLATDGRVKSRSVGDGLYKKIKIYPVKEAVETNG